MSKWFTTFSEKASALAGHYLTFIVALGLVAVWAVSGPFLRFSEVWQLTINTSTTIVTFLMVFLLQNTQNRDSKALHVKLNALIEAIEAARNEVMVAEEETDAELDRDLQRERNEAAS